MFIIIEPDLNIRKKICDILHKERIIGVDSITAAVEKICWFRNDINLILARINFDIDILQKKVITKICNKLIINEPPVIGYFLMGEEDILAKIPGDINKLPIIEYDETEPDFPRKLINLVEGLYPKVNYDLETTNEKWLHKDEKPIETVDPRKWLEEEGFVELIQKPEEKKKEPGVEQIFFELNQVIKEIEMTHSEKGEADYKKLYYDLMEKYDKLLKLFQELRESI